MLLCVLLFQVSDHILLLFPCWNEHSSRFPCRNWLIRTNVELDPVKQLLNSEPTGSGAHRLPNIPTISQARSKRSHRFSPHSPLVNCTSWFNFPIASQTTSVQRLDSRRYTVMSPSSTLGGGNNHNGTVSDRGKSDLPVLDQVLTSLHVSQSMEWLNCPIMYTKMLRFRVSMWTLSHQTSLYLHPALHLHFLSLSLLLRCHLDQQGRPTISLTSQENSPPIKPKSSKKKGWTSQR